MSSGQTNICTATAVTVATTADPTNQTRIDPQTAEVQLRFSPFWTDNDPNLWAWHCNLTTWFDKIVIEINQCKFNDRGHLCSIALTFLQSRSICLGGSFPSGTMATHRCLATTSLRPTQGWPLAWWVHPSKSGSNGIKNNHNMSNASTRWDQGLPSMPPSRVCPMPL